MDTTNRLTTALADRYAIETAIDSGGMATVYRARDLKHERTVAIKVLRPDLAEAIGADRFLREIRTTANLSHPHILPLHDSGEASGFLYYVMPFVEGESLANRLEREGQLPVEDAVQIAREVSEALAYAHRKGVIHRDVKPANVMLEEGHALLADFGIAQARATAEETKLTGSGMSLGTPSYMSPEQISGDRELDGRADQYALGCVLYEMLAGRPPFEGADIQTVMRQHLAAEAPKVTGARATVPAGVAKALHRALAKSPADRFRTMEELEKALAGATLPLLARIPMGRARALVYGVVVILAIAGGVVLGRNLLTEGSTADGDVLPLDKSVIALPLENLSGNPDLDRLSELAAGFISSGLSQADRLDPGLLDRVIPSWRLEASAEAWTDVTTASLAVVGSYHLLGDSIRFQVQVHNRSGQVLDSPEHVSAPLDKPEAAFEALQWRAVSAVAGQVSPGHIIARVNLHSHLPEPEALDLYLQARTAHLVESDGTDVRLLERAVEADPDYLAPLIQLIWWSGHNARTDSLCTALEARAAQMTRFERLDMEGGCARIRGDARTALEKAIGMLDYVPNQVNDVAVTLLRLNRPGEALEYWARRDHHASEFDWLFTPRVWLRQCQALHLLGEHERELEVALQARDTFPDDERGYRAMAPALAALGRLEELEPLIERWSVRHDVHIQSLYAVGAELEIHGYPEAARRLIWEPAIQRYEARPTPDTVSNPARYLAGMAYLVTDRPGEARRLLEPLVEALQPYMEGLAHVGVVAARQGDTATAHRMLERIAEFDSPWDHGMPKWVSGVVLANLGERDRAMVMLEQGVENGVGEWLAVHQNLLLRPLWDYPPFQDLVRPKG
jgi:serine/threonine protein kinase